MRTFLVLLTILLFGCAGKQKDTKQCEVNRLCYGIDNAKCRGYLPFDSIPETDSCMYYYYKDNVTGNVFYVLPIY